VTAPLVAGAVGESAAGAGAAGAGAAEAGSGSAATGARAGAAGGGGGLLAGLSGGKKTRRPPRKALVAEFLACMVVCILQPLAGAASPGPWMKKTTAVAAVYLVLGLISATGETPRRVANGLGLLVFLAVVISQDTVFSALAGALGADGSAGNPDAVGGRTPGEVVGDIIGGDPTIDPNFTPGGILG
jgi:hypothetical protein